MLQIFPKIIDKLKTDPTIHPHQGEQNLLHQTCQKVMSARQERYHPKMREPVKPHSLLISHPILTGKKNDNFNLVRVPRLPPSEDLHVIFNKLAVYELDRNLVYGNYIIRNICGQLWTPTWFKHILHSYQGNNLQGDFILTLYEGLIKKFTSVRCLSNNTEIHLNASNLVASDSFPSSLMINMGQVRNEAPRK